MSKRYIPEFDYWFSKYWEANADIRITNNFIPEMAFNSEVDISVGTLAELLFKNYYPYDDVIFNLKQVSYAEILTKNVTSRLSVKKSKPACYIFSDELTASNELEITNDEFTLIEHLREYKSDGTSDISDIDFEYLDSTFSKLIYLYLDIVLNQNFQVIPELNNLQTSSFLHNIFKLYALNEAHKLLKLSDIILESEEIRIKPVRSKFIYGDSTGGELLLTYPKPINIEDITIYVDGIIKTNNYQKTLNPDNSVTVTISSGVNDDSIIVIDYYTRDTYVVRPVTIDSTIVSEIPADSEDHYGYSDTVIPDQPFLANVLPPIIYNASISEYGEPMWAWKTGGQGGTGIYRYKIDEDGEWIETADTLYVHTSAEVGVPYTLYVQELGERGEWSTTEYLSMTSPWSVPSPVKPPIITGVSLSANGYPTWTWITGGHGVALFRIKFALTDEWIEVGADTTYTLTGIETGTQTIYLQEQGQLGDWSASKTNSIFTNIYDSPSAPIVSGDTTTSDITPTWTWVTGGGGIGLYKYSLDGSPWASTFNTSYTSTTPQFNGEHVFRVREINFDGVWGDIAEFTTIISDAYPEGSFMGIIGGLGQADGLMSSIVSVSVTDDEVYVLDNDRCDVQVFNKYGVYLRKIGGEGAEDGLFLRPRCVAVQQTGNDILVAVSDFEKVEVQLFNGVTGVYIEKIGGDDSNTFDVPEGMCFYDNELYVVDSMACKVKVFNGTSLDRMFGTEGELEGQFTRPYDIHASEAGVFVTDGERSKLLKFTYSGVFVQEWTLGS